MSQALDLGDPCRVGPVFVSLALAAPDPLVRCLRAGCWAGEQCLLQRHEEEVATVPSTCLPSDLDVQQSAVRALFFLRSGKPTSEYLAILERLLYLLLDVLLETAYHQARSEVIPGVVVWIGDGRRIQHVDEAGEAPRLAIVRRRGKHDERVGSPGEQLGEAATQRTRPPVGHVVRFIDHDDVPVSLLEIGAVLGVLLQRVDGDDRLVVVVERVVVRRDAAAHTLYADRVKPREGDREAVPELLLELGQHALHGQDEDTSPSPARD